jgi:acetyl esterase/lipase
MTFCSSPEGSEREGVDGVGRTLGRMAIVEAPIAVEQDVVYGRGGDRELRCDIYRPAPSANKRTAIVQLPGGGFRRANKAGTRLARPLATLGYTSVSAEYRVLPEGVWPVPLHDAKAAIRWTRAHAADLDIDKVVVLGYSAGGRLALVLSATQNDPNLEGDSGSAGQSTEIAACVAFYPASADLSRHPVVGDSPSPELLRSTDILGNIRAGFPPTLLLHGTADQTIPVDQSVSLYGALRAAGVPVELHVIEGVTHIFDIHEDFAAASATWIDLFLDRHVVSPRRYPSTEPSR